MEVLGLFSLSSVKKMCLQESRWLPLNAAGKPMCRNPRGAGAGDDRALPPPRSVRWHLDHMPDCAIAGNDTVCRRAGMLRAYAHKNAGVRASRSMPATGSLAESRATRAPCVGVAYWRDGGTGAIGPASVFAWPSPRRWCAFPAGISTVWTPSSHGRAMVGALVTIGSSAVFSPSVPSARVVAC